MLNSKTDTGVNLQLLAPGTPAAPQPWIVVERRLCTSSTSTYSLVHANAGTSTLEWNTKMLPRALGDFRTSVSFPESAFPSARNKKNPPISSAKQTLGPPVSCSSYLSDLDFSSTVPFAFLAGHLESQRHNYFSAFCWDGGMSLLWNAAWLANGVTQDGWTEATGMKRIDEEEGKWSFTLSGSTYESLKRWSNATLLHATIAHKYWKNRDEKHWERNWT